MSNKLQCELLILCLTSPPSTQTETRETLLGFNMVNYRACKNLWKACVEHHTFFRLERPVPPQKNFFAHYFTLGSKFRYWWEQGNYTLIHVYREQCAIDREHPDVDRVAHINKLYIDQPCGCLVCLYFCLIPGPINRSACLFASWCSYFTYI